MKKKWYRLDNAALIFPAVMRRHWNNSFRVSVTFSEPVDISALSRALLNLRHRFPTFFVRLRKGAFWNYLEEIEGNVQIREDYAYPLTHMSRRQLRKCCIRVFYFNNRVAVEFFHSVTDGTGGMEFLKNLAAEYLHLRYDLRIPREEGILSLEEEPSQEELEDAFIDCSGKYAIKEHSEVVYRLRGEPEYDWFKHLTTGIIDAKVLLERAHEYKATVTAFLGAVMAESIIKIQARQVKEKRQRPVKIGIPVNLRKLYHKKTLRNFILPVDVGVDPKTGTYTLQELCNQFSHQLAQEVVPQKMASRIAANVLPAQNPILKRMPLAIKYFAMGRVYDLRGESLECLNVSNLGVVHVPKEMEPYIKRFEFIIGVQLSYPNNCSVASFKGRTFINMIRSTKSAELEQIFFSRLVELGVPVEIESNDLE